MTKFTYVDLFSGIGGFRIALDSLGGKSLGYSEIDKFAIETYQLNFKDPLDHNLGDVTKITKFPAVDVVVGGVPCQSWSVAGKRRGFDDPRGRLWFDTILIVKKSKPKIFVFENVKGLADPRNMENLNLIKSSFEELGYVVFTKVLNSYDYKCPQNRSRIFIVGFRNDMKKFSLNFQYPEKQEHTLQLADFLDNVKRRNIKKEKISADLLFENGKIPLSRNAFQLVDEFNDFFTLCDTRNGHTTIHSWDIKNTSKFEKQICMAVLKNRRKKKYGDFDGNPLSLKDISMIIDKSITKHDIKGLVAKKILRVNKDGRIDLVNSKNSAGIDGIYRIFLPNSLIFSTITATGTRDYVATKYITGKTVQDYKENFIKEILLEENFRTVTPKEALRIQGFPKEFKTHQKDIHMYKQVGNSVSPLVVEALFKNILETKIFS